MKVSDYIIKFLESQGVRHIFMFTGGMTMHINDSIDYSKIIKPVFMLHEQGCTFAAESYARITNNLGVVVATCGPGATNTITGIACSWIESTPLLVITGQCKRDDIAQNPDLRQFGVQEVKITEIVKPITKYATTILDPLKIKYELEKAVAICRSGRPGPVLLDIPVDVQACSIDEASLIGFNNSFEKPLVDNSQLNQVVDLINRSQRPVFYVGAGVNISNARAVFRELAEKLGIPVLVNWDAMDILENSHPLYVGRPGAVGQRSANFTLQNSDLLISIGTRLSLLQTGYNFKGYARNAKHIMVDIDEAELNKKNIHPDIKIHADAYDFIVKLKNHPGLEKKKYTTWIKIAKNWMESYPTVKDEWRKTVGYVNSYHLMECISSKMTEDDIYIGGRAGTCVDAAIQAFIAKRNQRVYVTKGLSSMGYGLPAAIGGWYATNKRIISVIGDGGFVMNEQELEVIRRDNLPIKLFILNNNGYATIRNTQTNVFNGHLVGCNPESGLTVGNIRKIAEAYDIKTIAIKDSESMTQLVEEAFAYEGPVVIDVVVSIAQSIEPRQASYKTAEGFMASRPLEDMKPLRPESEVRNNMSVSER